MRFWNKKENERAVDNNSTEEGESQENEQKFDESDDILKELYFSDSTSAITMDQALEIPAVQSAIEKISNIVSTLDIQLYKAVHKDGECRAELVKHDPRVELINQDTGDTLDGVMLKKALVRDYFLSGRAHAYINKVGNEVKSIHYVDATLVSFNENTDPIFKDYDILVNGNTYMPFDFLTITRNSKNGYKGKGIVDENNNVLNVGYSMVLEELRQIKNGGQKKGYVKSKHKLAKGALEELKSAWRKLYKSDDSVIVLNDGLDFGEISNTAVEMQLKEKKDSNTKDIHALFGISDINNDIDVIKNAVMPFLNAFEKGCDRVLLLEEEKENEYYFKFDVKNLLKGTIKERYEAYNSAIKTGWMSRNEARYFEDLEKIDGLDLITFSLGEVIFDIETKKFFTPNTGDKTDLSKEEKLEEKPEEKEEVTDQEELEEPEEKEEETEGGEDNEDRGKEQESDN